MNSAIGSSRSPCRRRTIEDGDDDADPGRAPDGAQPVALVGDLAMPAEDGQPGERDERQGDGQADEDGSDEPGARDRPADRGS